MVVPAWSITRIETARSSPMPSKKSARVDRFPLSACRDVALRTEHVDCLDLRQGRECFDGGQQISGSHFCSLVWLVLVPGEVTRGQVVQVGARPFFCPSGRVES